MLKLMRRRARRGKSGGRERERRDAPKSIFRRSPRSSLTANESANKNAERRGDLPRALVENR